MHMCGCICMYVHVRHTRGGLPQSFPHYFSKTVSLLNIEITDSESWLTGSKVHWSFCLTSAAEATETHARSFSLGAGELGSGPYAGFTRTFLTDSSSQPLITVLYDIWALDQRPKIQGGYPFVYMGSVKHRPPFRRVRRQKHHAVMQ